MIKLTPDPPALRVRQDLSSEVALLHAHKHLACAIAATRQALEHSGSRAELLIQGVFYQVEVAKELVEVSLKNLRH
uniref:hypothetical protein n=1 Tax=Pseudomonas laurentiana TaxID=2364649 RepID=UPI0029C78076|nr:hypothetical protein [Pseudomonas laurentiana]